MDVADVGVSPATEGAGGASGSAAARPPQLEENPLDQDLAVSVTRQVQISGPTSWKHLVSGVDTLDVGLYVQWGDKWPSVLEALEKGKAAAAGTQGIRWRCPGASGLIIFAGGKAPMYRFHLQSARFHAFLAGKESKKYPGVYVSILAKALWFGGVRASVNHVVQFIEKLGGRVKRVQVSRSDLCADFLIPGGLSLEFLREHLVSRSGNTSHFMNGDALETFYAGSPGSELRLRIYNKSRWRSSPARVRSCGFSTSGR